MKKIEVLPSGRVRVATINELPDMCQTQYEKQCDVNNIMRKYEKDGIITHLAKNPGRYAQLGEPQDLMEAKMRVIRAEESFMALPPDLRAKCDNDPAKFLQMLKDGSNDEQLIKLGIITKKQAPTGESGSTGAGSGQETKKEA